MADGALYPHALLIPTGLGQPGQNSLAIVKARRLIGSNEYPDPHPRTGLSDAAQQGAGAEVEEYS